MILKVERDDATFAMIGIRVMVPGDAVVEQTDQSLVSVNPSSIMLPFEVTGCPVRRVLEGVGVTA